jgi:hypothetical protein
MNSFKARLLRSVATRDAAPDAPRIRKTTVVLRQHVELRVKEPDPMGQPPHDLQGQPIIDRHTGQPAKAFKTVTHSFKKGANLMDADLAKHPYIKAHAVEQDEDAAPEFTADQLRQMLAAAELREGGSDLTLQPESALNGRPGDGNASSSLGDGARDQKGGTGREAQVGRDGDANNQIDKGPGSERQADDQRQNGQQDQQRQQANWPAEPELENIRFDVLGALLLQNGVDPVPFNSTEKRKDAVRAERAKAQAPK